MSAPTDPSPASPPPHPSARRTVLSGVAVVVAALYLWLARSGLIEILGDRAALRAS